MKRKEEKTKRGKSWFWPAIMFILALAFAASANAESYSVRNYMNLTYPSQIAGSSEPSGYTVNFTGTFNITEVKGAASSTCIYIYIVSFSAPGTFGDVLAQAPVDANKIATLNYQVQAGTNYGIWMGSNTSGGNSTDPTWSACNRYYNTDNVPTGGMVRENMTFKIGSGANPDFEDATNSYSIEWVNTRNNADN